MRVKVYAVAIALLISLQVAPTDALDWRYTNANSAGTNSVQQWQLNRSNAGSLALSWTYPFPSAMPPAGLNGTGEGAIAPPLVVEGVVYVVMNDLRILAIRATDGRLVWSYQPLLNRTGLPLGILVGHVHGLTYRDGKIWVSLPDCSALALRAEDGTPVERISRICEDIPGNAGRYGYSGAPLVFYRDLLIWTASSVSESTDAGRGFVAAYNLSDSRLRWRWYVSPPAGGDPNWDSDSCSAPCHGNVPPYPGDWGTLGLNEGRSRAGAAPSWGQAAVDEADGILFLGTSQPSPDWNATYRPGPNLYSDSVIALNASTGKMLWYYQTTPHDLYDFDCGWNVVLGSVTVDGSNTTAVFKACKNGYVYALGAKSGRLLWYFNPPSIIRSNTQNADYALTGKYDPTERWAQSENGTVTQCPGINGGVEADVALAYGHLFVATHNFCAFVTIGPVSKVGAGISGANRILYDFRDANTTVYSVNASTGKEMWSHLVSGVPYRGWLTVSGGVVFASTLEGEILAFDSKDGSLVGSTHVGGSLYEGITIGSDSLGSIKIFQLTSSPAYGGFSTGVPGDLLALSPVQPQPMLSYYINWVLAGTSFGLVTLIGLTFYVKWRRALRISLHDASRITDRTD